MEATSPSKIHVNKITQVAIVVEDVEKTALDYWNIIGIGPWDIYEWTPPLVYDRKYHGKLVWGRERVAVADVGGVQLELSQPVEGDSIYRDFLNEHGEGLQHVQFADDDFDETVRILTEEYGFPSLQSGRCGEKCGFNYIYIEPLHAIWEPVPADLSVAKGPDVIYPDSKEQSSAKVEVKRVTQVGIVVKDVEKTALAYWNILGIGPWDIYDWTPPLVYDRKYHGKLTWGRDRIAIAELDGVKLELCQPVEGESIYRDFLNEHGEGLHHVQFVADDLDETARILTEEYGFPSLQSGRCGPPEGKGSYNYIDIKPLCAIWEPVSYDVNNIGAEPIRLPR